MAPPRIGKTIELRLTTEALDKIDARAAEQGLSRSQLIRKMLDWAVAQPSAKAGRHA